MRKCIAIITYSFILLGLFFDLAGSTTAQEDHFPKQISYEIRDLIVPWDFEISNSAEYMTDPVLEEEFYIKATQSEDILYTGSGAHITAGWSVSNEYIALGFNGENACPFGLVQTYLTLLNTRTREKTSLCLPLDRLSLAWSPFSDKILFADETWLIDLENQTATRDTSDGDYGFGFRPDQFVGYGRYLWHRELQTPSGEIDLGTTVFAPTPTEMFGPAEPATIESAWFEYCELIAWGVPITCQKILDITANYPRAFVHDWQIATNNMMVWLAAESNSDEPIPALGIHRAEYADTVLYMTDLMTLETREIFRLSELGMEDIFSSSLDWSPDGNTIALALSSAIGRHVSGQQLLILHLEYQ